MTHQAFRRERWQTRYRCTTCQRPVGTTIRDRIAHRDFWLDLFARFGTRVTT